MDESFESTNPKKFCLSYCYNILLKSLLEFHAKRLNFKHYLLRTLNAVSKW
jgi:hypothetical protein